MRELEPSKFEVVAGARRLRAARIAELELHPVRVFVKLTDAEAIEAQVVENLQREDIHPFGRSTRLPVPPATGKKPTTIARHHSQSGQRDLCLRQDQTCRPDSASGQAFLKDQITIGHALLIAKLPASQQQEALPPHFAACGRAKATVKS